MDEKQAIDSAAAEKIRVMFNVFFDESNKAVNDQQRMVAEQRYTNGVAFVRKARERAIALLG